MSHPTNRQSPSAATEFMKQVRRALGRPDGAVVTPPPIPPVDEAVVRQVSSADPGRVGRWIEQARSNGITVREAAPGGWAGAVGEILQAHSVQRLLINVLDSRQDAEWSAVWQSLALTITRWGDPQSPAAAFAADATLTDCRYAIADTGSLLVWSENSFGRSSTLTAPVHIALVRREQILPDLVDAMQLLARQPLPSNAVIINGPSKTTDIEGNLVVGVHGPKHLYAIVTD